MLEQTPELKPISYGFWLNTTRQDILYLIRFLICLILLRNYCLKSGRNVSGIWPSRDIGAQLIQESLFLTDIII